MCCESLYCPHLMQDETGHSSMMCISPCGPVDCFQAGLAMWAYNAACWMDAKHTVPITVQVPLVDRLCR